MKPSEITPHQFRNWRKGRGMTALFCADTMGISISSVWSYENGKRFEGEVKIPLLVAWAMAAIEAGLKPYGGNYDNDQDMPPGAESIRNSGFPEEHIGARQ